MRKIYCLLLSVIAVASSFSAHTQSSVNHLVISQVYGGGGNSGATYKNDFIELYNPTNSDVSLTGWSVQYASTTGTSWSKTDLSGSIPAHGYFLIQQAQGSAGTVSLPNPDIVPFTGIAMAAGAGKVALLNVNSLITSGTSCPTANVVDFVGYGTTTNCFEGPVGPTPTLTNTTAALRKNSGCTDTDNNSGDFTTGGPNPRSSTSPLNICPVECTAPTNQPATLSLTASVQSISGSFSAAGTGVIAADNYLVIMSTSSSLSHQPASGTTYSVGNSLGNAQVVSVNNITSFTVTGLSSSTTYYFFIYSYTSAGPCYNIVLPLTGNATTNAIPTISVSTGSNAAEASTNGSFIINFNPATSSSTNIDFAFTGTASFGTDYTVSYSTGSTSSTASIGTLTIPTGTSSISITVTPVNDALVEGLENITLTLSNADGGYSLATPAASINLSDDDLAIASATAGINATEPATTGSFTINLSTPAPAGGVTVLYSLGGTATLSADFSDANNGSIIIAEGTTVGTLSLNVIDDLQFEVTETITLTLNSATNGFSVSNSAATINLLDNDNPKVVINQIYGGGGNSGATYRNDFIELYNNENVAVSLSGWSVQYAGATSGTWQVTPLTGTIPAHGFYLIREAAGTGGTTNLPTPDDAGSIPMGAGAGKVILSNSATPVSGANPVGTSVIDKVGYGSTATGFETIPAAGPLDNTVAVKRNVDGVDNNNNSTDFILDNPDPRNRFETTAPPVIVTLSPPDNSVGIPYNIATNIVFNKTVVKGTGNITIYQNDVAVATIDVNSSAVTITNKKTVTINFAYTPGNSYHINIDPTAFYDLYGNNFAGFTNNSAWNFTTYNSTVATPLPANFDFQNCTGTGLLPNGFTQFSITGSVLWDCTPFGRDPLAPAGTAQFPNAIQVNGFSSILDTNIPNVDWLISPSFDLTGTVYPLLAFWSRTAFNGLPLQLKISTDYPGTGDPRNYTWTDLNGKFPLQASNVWTLSSDINLAAFKQPNVHIAFIYTSTDDDGARWTLDDFSIINSATPPPPSLTVGISDIQFGYVANGATGDKTFSFIGNDLTEDISISSNGAFLLSKDGSSYSSSIVYTVAEANNLSQTAYVRFAPTQADQNFTGTVTVSTTNNIRTITTKGTSIDPVTTLEVVNWNVEWFGSSTMEPNNDELQEQNVETILNNVGADIFGLVEVVDESRLARVVSHMPGYSYVIGNFGSHVNPPDPTGGSIADAQKLAFVYKTSLFSNVSARPLINNQSTSSTSYNNWASGRYPFLMKADVNLNGVTKTINFVLIHAKANTSPTTTSYNRRQASAKELHDTLMQYFPNENVVVLGDFNDDLDVSITAGFTTTSYSSFTNDPANFFSPTLALSLAGKKSTVSYNDMIDHVMLSNEMQPWYMQGSATVLSDVSSLVTNYGSTTTDHYPIFTRYMFCKLTAPSDITVSNDEGQCGAIVNFNAAATMTCGTVTAVPASGSFFPIGTTTVQLTAGTGETASFKVTVTDDEKPLITAPAGVTTNADAGQCQTIKDHVNLGTATFSDNCSGTTVINDAPPVFPVGSTTVTWTATDASGNTATATQLITIEDHELPGIVQPLDITVSSETGKCSAGVTLQAPPTTDNCAVASVTNDAPANGVYAVGTHTITWTVTDIHDNSATTTQRIIVNDTEKPIVTNCPVVPVLCYKPSGQYSIPAIAASDNCGTVSYSYIISGATTRNGSSPDASGAFNIGVSTITWTVTDSHNNTNTCQTLVTINSPVTSNIPDVYAVNQGGEANTIYIGYGPSSVTLNASVSGGSGDYSYKWTSGSSAGPGVNSSSYTARPDTTTTYYFNVKDRFNCSAPVTTKTVSIVDVRCGAKLDKVSVCSVVKGRFTNSCLNTKDVANALSSGSFLGSCASPTSMTRINVSENLPASLIVNGMPNPSTNYFTITISGGQVSEKITLNVTDALGRVVEQKRNLQTGSTIQIGEGYRAGMYIAEIVQGSVRKQIKLVKL